MDQSSKGFTIVELIVVITVIAILATIGTVSYNGYQERAEQSAMQHDLVSAKEAMEIDAIHKNDYSTTLPTGVAMSDKVSLQLITNPLIEHYSSMSTVQNGVLFAEICQELIDEGVGKGKDLGGTTNDYVTGCGNWNDDSTQITGWSSKKFNTPVTSADITGFADNYPPKGSWHLNQQSVIQTFYNTLHDRFLTKGGTFPVTSFWDFWATPTNGGVMHQDLPTPDPPGTSTSTFCIEATHSNPNTPKWHIITDRPPKQGGC